MFTKKMKMLDWSVLAVAGWLACTAPAQISVPGADGSDGAFHPTSNTLGTINLATARTGVWNDTNISPGNGTYDPEKWAVVYRYSSVEVPSGVTVTFLNHPSHAPVVWLVNGDVTINGRVVLDGANSIAAPAEAFFAEGGPGGFRGGVRSIIVAGTTVTYGSSGLGPGGGHNGDTLGTSWAGTWHGGFASSGCGFPTPESPTNSSAYGSASLIPLIGGSGGSRTYCPGCVGSTGVFGGGGGGGAILIAATGRITIGSGTGVISANGGFVPLGWGLGSGGGIRLVASEIVANGILRAINSLSEACPPDGQEGRIRLEYISLPNAAVDAAPTYFRRLLEPGDVATLWPSDLAPSVNWSVAIESIDDGPARRDLPSDPRSRLARTAQGGADFNIAFTSDHPVYIRTTNVPTNGDAAVLLRHIPTTGADAWLPATFVSTNGSDAIWRVVVGFAFRGGGRGFGVLQATAHRARPIAQIPIGISREVSYEVLRACAADLDDGTITGTPDGAVTIEDLLFFLAAFEAGNVAADLDNDGDPASGTPDGAVTIEDLVFFLARFEAGC